jgi:hypothetical protein
MASIPETSITEDLLFRASQIPFLSEHQLGHAELGA